MAAFGSAKHWIALTVVGGIFGIILWSGLSVLTLKTILLWTLITFGFLTLLLHALGSPLFGLISKFFKEEEKPKKAKFSKEQLAERRQKILKDKQDIFDEKSNKYKEEILDPRREAQRAKKEAEIHKFTGWKGHGHKLGSDIPPGCSCGHPHDDTDTDPDTLLENIDMADSSSDDEPASQLEVSADIEISAAETSGNTVRQRRGKHVDGALVDEKSDSISDEANNDRLTAEPELGSPGAITVALRCPDGNTKKRRFTRTSKLQELVTYAEILGYPSSQFVIMSTYPRKPLDDSTFTFEEIGLTHDVVLVIDEKED